MINEKNTKESCTRVSLANRKLIYNSVLAIMYIMLALKSYRIFKNVLYTNDITIYIITLIKPFVILLVIQGILSIILFETRIQMLFVSSIILSAYVSILSLTTGFMENAMGFLFLVPLTVVSYSAIEFIVFTVINQLSKWFNIVN